MLVGTRVGRPLRIVTGAGRHSEYGKARIRPAVISYLERRTARFTATDGEIIVTSIL